MSRASKPLWTCPKCGHRFVTRNLWHSCGRYELGPHFASSNPQVRATFDRLVEAASACGPLTVYPQKTRIVFMVRVRFGGVVTRKRWLLFSLWLTRRIEHPSLRRVDVYGPRAIGHQFQLDDPRQVDSRLRSLICEAYSVGRQEHLTAR